MERLNESLGFDASAVNKAKNKWRVKVIESGWGSSGYYGADMLAKYGPKVFAKGTKVYMNHPSMSEAVDRPERDVHQLAGKLITDSYFQENALYADVEFYSHYAPIINEMAGDIGLSIHAMGAASFGEAEGKEGPIVETLVADPLTSVDVVTVAGAGGKFISLLESYKSKDNAANWVAESETEKGKNMSITKEEFDAAIAEVKAAFVEAIAPLRESVSVLVEAAAADEAEVTADETEPVEDATPALDPVEVAEKFNESGLPKIALTRVAESLKSEANTKTVDELIAAEKSYADALRADVAVEAPVVGFVQEAAKATSALDEFEAITSRIANK